MRRIYMPTRTPQKPRSNISLRLAGKRRGNPKGKNSSTETTRSKYAERQRGSEDAREGYRHQQKGDFLQSITLRTHQSANFGESLCELPTPEC